MGLSAQDAEVEEMREWKVARLREALQRRKLSIKGRRPELVTRLERALRRRAGEVEVSPAAAAAARPRDPGRLSRRAESREVLRNI